jgi:hypothetical protein
MRVSDYICILNARELLEIKGMTLQSIILTYYDGNMEHFISYNCIYKTPSINKKFSLVRATHKEYNDIYSHYDDKGIYKQEELQNKFKKYFVGTIHNNYVNDETQPSTYYQSWTAL